MEIDRGPAPVNRANSAEFPRIPRIGVSDHQQSSFFGLSPEAGNIIRAEGASHQSDHQRYQ